MVEYVKFETNSKPQKKEIAIASVVMPIIIINIIVFILQLNFGDFMKEYFLMISSEVFSKPWTLLTTTFMHGSFAHILFNMYALLIFGTLLEAKIGPKRFLYMYLIIAIVSSFIGTFIYSAALGASGAVMGVIGALIVLMPKLKLYLFFAIPMQLWFAGIVFFFIDIFGILTPNNVANVAHIVGMLMGLAYGFYIYSNRKRFQKKFSKKKVISKKDMDEYKKNY